MQEILERALDYLRGMWHRRWIGLAVAWAVAVLGVAVVYKIPEKYEAQARVYVDTESLLRPLLAGLAIQPNLEQQVALISRTLVSRPNLEKLLRLADLDLNVRTPSERDELIDHIIRTIKLEGSSTTNLYLISYRDPEPARARRVVQSLLTIFMESSLGDKRQDTQTAVKFLDDQIKRYEQSLRTAEDRMKDFRIKYLGVSGRDTDYFTRMGRLSAEIESAKVELHAAEESRDAYKRETVDEAPPSLIPDDAVDVGSILTPDIDVRLAALHHDLDSLLRKYTDEHPDVAATKRLIAELEEQRKTEVAAKKKVAVAAARRNPAAQADQNPVTQQVRISLADAEANVAGMKAKVSGLQAQYDQLRAQASMVPKIETDYTQLVRDYDVQKKTYDNLVARRESALMGKDVQDTGGAQFRVIDPPRVSPKPVEPNRIVFLALAFLLALGAGTAASFVASEIAPTFHDARALRKSTSRPLLGMISMLPSAALRRARRRNAWLFAGGVSGLLVSFAGVFAFVLFINRVT